MRTRMTKMAANPMAMHDPFPSANVNTAIVKRKLSSTRMILI
jgi:hypothetical protein